MCTHIYMHECRGLGLTTSVFSHFPSYLSRQGLFAEAEYAVLASLASSLARGIPCLPGMAGMTVWSPSIYVAPESQLLILTLAQMLQPLVLSSNFGVTLSHLKLSCFPFSLSLIL